MHFESSQFKKKPLLWCQCSSNLMEKGFTINCVKYDSILIRHEMSGFESCKLLVKINQEQLGASGKSVTISV